MRMGMADAVIRLFPSRLPCSSPALTAPPSLTRAFAGSRDRGECPVFTGGSTEAVRSDQISQFPRTHTGNYTRKHLTPGRARASDRLRNPLVAGLDRRGIALCKFQTRRSLSLST